MDIRFRADGRTLVAALRFVMEELARGRHNLFVSTPPHNSHVFSLNEPLKISPPHNYELLQRNLV